jgi:hypothetical protein
LPTNRRKLCGGSWHFNRVAARMIESPAWLKRRRTHRHWGDIMNFSLSAPRRETFLVSAIIAILVVIGMIVPLPFFTSYALGLILIAYLVLVAGVLIDGL